MNYNLTNAQKDLVRWFVNEIRENHLPEEFSVSWVMGERKYIIHEYTGNDESLPELTIGMLNVLDNSELIHSTPEFFHDPEGRYSHGQGQETGRFCVLRGAAYDAVDTDFAAPDTSFVAHLTPLADITNLDEEIKSRCLPILGAGSTNPRLWDSAVRTAGVILEERLRDVGGIADRSRVGRDLVNDVFGKNGTLASKFHLDAEKQGYRDLYAGIVGAFRNPYAHRLVDPIPEDGGALMVFINLLLKRLEDLR